MILPKTLLTVWVTLAIVGLLYKNLINNYHGFVDVVFYHFSTNRQLLVVFEYPLKFHYTFGLIHFFKVSF